VTLLRPPRSVHPLLGSPLQLGDGFALGHGRPPGAARWLDLARRLDWVLLGSVLLLAGLGSLVVWSATRVRLENAGADPKAMLYRHLINLAVGLVLAAAVTLLDYRKLRIYAPLLYLGSVLGLLLVLTPLGYSVHGSHSWFRLGGLSAQPVEFAKVALCAGLALLLAERREATAGFRHAEVPQALLLAVVPTGLVLLQPDLGSIIVLAAITGGVLVVAAVPWWWIIGLAAAAVATVAGAVWSGMLSEYQVNRFAAFANPALDPQGVGYNANQARIAIGSGGLLGKGLFEGSQTSGQFVPEQHTDFIFTVAGEELGLLGGGTILLLFTLVLWRACAIAARAADLFGTLVATGVVCWFGLQIFQNIGMAVGLTPVTGLPLPFLSYGGTAMFANLMAVGLLQNVHLRARR
jgi:rod shape determining protein RodA